MATTTRNVVKPKPLTESQEQTLLATWLDKRRIKFFAIPNGGSRHYLEAISLRRGGVKRGVPDIFIPISSGSYHGMFLELKRVKGGVVSEEQKDWIAYLAEAGYFVSVCYGFEQAKDVVLHYLNLTPTAA